MALQSKLTNNMKYKILKNHFIDLKSPTTNKPVRLYRIIALENFNTQNGTVRTGDIGGFIQSAATLSQSDTSWVYHTGKVFDDAILSDSVILEDGAGYGQSVIRDSIISGRARISGTCSVIRDSLISGNATVEGDCEISNSTMTNATRVFGKCKVTNTLMSGGSIIRDNSTVNNSTLSDIAEINGNSVIDNCQFSGRTVVSNSRCAGETRSDQIELNIIQQVLPDSTKF